MSGAHPLSNEWSRLAQTIPVIAIDGPTASGKGTVASLVAQRLGFHYLDSGAIYRVLAYAAMQNMPLEMQHPHLNWPEPHLKMLEDLAWQLPVAFEHDGIWLTLGNTPQNVSEAIRTEMVGETASKLAAIPAIRQALLARQQAFKRMPGLVADGRDMGTVVFPDAALKIFLTASPEVRAQRRVAQLNAKLKDGQLPVEYAVVYAELLQRDARDTNRPVAPLKPSENAKVLNTSTMDVIDAVNSILGWYTGSF